MSNRWRGSDSSDVVGGIVGMIIGTVGFPVLTYLFVPYTIMMTKTPVLFWIAMFTPFVMWVVFQAAMSLYAKLMIRPIPARDWTRTIIGGSVAFAGSMLYVGPWLATVTFGYLYGPHGPS